MPTRYISNELTDQRGSNRASEVQPITLYQKRQVVFVPNFCHSRASISSNSTAQLSALRAWPKLLRARRLVQGGCPRNGGEARSPKHYGRTRAAPTATARPQSIRRCVQTPFIRDGSNTKEAMAMAETSSASYPRMRPLVHAGRGVVAQK
jgi:hypothetical protein